MFLMLCLAAFALAMAAAPDLHEMADTITLAGEPAVTDTDDQDPETEQSEPEIVETTDETQDDTDDDQDPDADPEEGAEAAQSDEEPDLSFLDEAEEVADPTREENIPVALRPMWRSAQAQITREQQRLSEQRKEFEHIAPLDKALRDAGIDPAQYAEVAQALQAAQSNPQDYAPEPQVQTTDTADPYASDPEILYLQGQLEEATTGPEEAALQQAIRFRAREIENGLRSAQQDARQQAEARNQAIENDLSRLEADPRLKPLLTDPANKTRVVREAQRPSLEVVAKGLDYDRLHLESEKRTRLAYKKGLELGRAEGRNGRAAMREASLPTGPSAKTAQDSKELEYRKGASLADMANQAEEKGLKWFKRR